MSSKIKEPVSVQDYERKFERMNHLQRFQLLRKHGMPMEDNHEALRRRRALELGLPANTPASHILYQIQYGGLACACSNDISGVSGQGDCYALMFPIDEIQTDTKRFQNRVDAFSELSAESVAKNYDPNKFDPVVLWRDLKKGKVFMLSGHSRYEGMKRRNEPEIPARFFEGTEAQAIQFARVDANRTANQENLVEDLKAYVLMRDGDENRGIEASTKKELSQTFKGKHTKLEAWSYLNPDGLFAQALKQDNLSAYPHIERNAQWVGQLRKDYKNMSNTQEEDCFNFFYSTDKNLRISKDDFINEVEKRLAWGKPRLFPECDRGGCSDLKDLSKRGPNADTYKELNRLQEYKQLINERLKTTDRAKKIYTQEERQRLLEVGQEIDQEMSRLKRDLNVIENQAALFGNYFLPEYNGEMWTLNGIEELQLQEFKTANLPEIKVTYRRKLIDDRKISSSSDVADLLRSVWDKSLIETQESFVVLYLNRANMAIGFYKHTIGRTDSVMIDEKLILGAALKSLAAGMIVAHNHPSGNLKPSEADKKFTKNLHAACKLLGIMLLDSMIITTESYTSLADEGLI